MKLLAQPAINYREKRQDLVTREEWEALFAPFPASVRYHMANLAAHNWHIIHDGDRVAALSPSNYHGHWMYLDGSRVEMSREEENQFFPVADDRHRYSDAYSTVWAGKAPDGSYRPPVIRQRAIVMPSGDTARTQSPESKP